ncbi:MAG: hypothetical protein RL768_665 [Nitrospirota bacterium]
MTSNSPSNQVPSPVDWHAYLAEAIRLALAPLVLLFAGFFTSNFIISGQYTWPRTSRTLALTLTVVILSYEFVYKEQLARRASPERAKSVLLYSCVIPYAVGVLVMLALWKL